MSENGIRAPRRVRGGLRVAFGVALVLVVALAAPPAWVLLSARGHVHRPSAAPSAPVALVLGAGLTRSGRPTPFLAARLDVAAGLYRRGQVRALLVSGDNRRQGYDEPTAMAAYLVAHGIPADKVVPDFAGRDTHDSCVRARQTFGADRVVVVSQGYHLPRAVALCRAAGLDAEGAAEVGTQQRYPAVWRRGRLRELPAAYKAAYDVLTRRQPVGGRERALQDALD